MSSQYYLEISSTKKAISEWEITSAVLNINNQANDEFLFSTSLAISINSKVKLYRDDTCIFSGTIYKAPEEESAKSDASTCYQALGPWQELEEIVYQQKWNCLFSYDDSGIESYNTLKSHIILGQDEYGNLIDIATQIRNILSYAITASADIAIGTINTYSPMLYDETKDISVATAIKRVLKWIPDAVSYFDYSKSTPTLNIHRRASLTSKDIDINNDYVKSYKITPREDLVINGVEVKYEKTHTQDGESWNTIETDAYPTNFNSQSKKALVMTVELEGYKATREEREIVCEELQTDSIEWWQEKVPFLRDAENIVIKEVNRNYPTYGYELISGSIPDWAITNADSAPDEMEAIFSYSTDSFNYAEKVVTHKFIATNASSKTFSRNVISEDEEPTPSNLAQSLYEALNSLKHDASIVLYNAKIEDFVGKSINLLNTKSDYSAMQSPVMNLSYNLFSDTLSIKAGAPSQLYPSNIAEIFRINRNRASTTNFSSKSSGKSASSYTLSINDTYPKENTISSDTLIESLSLGSSESPKKIDLDSSEVPYGLSMKVTKVLVAQNGEESYAYILMTEPKTQAELDQLEADRIAAEQAQAESET